ncbi:outer membrane protein [Rhodopseudomonas pseudopalustris]|uniref:Outer membrane immunogenic protein n=1 Tax=Rhodopseudomonas pseudopalustris TaxID=1513892 RepID=A0A1H8U114_9BRAD|nr:outer membrane beta-barrel protein [Rhodopseudomonas pseudopalustris]SEO96554.1 outer membrane immunogenic protein [Rhodopseudomonas pseudopalustris]
MKKLLVGVALVGSAVSAQAADLAVRAPYVKAPVAAIYDWTGFYIGGNVGVGVGRNLQSHVFPAGGVANSSYLQPQGVIGGGQIGYNWQTNSVFGPLLIGVEADIQGSGMSDGRTTLNTLNGVLGTVNYNQKLDWFTTVRGRIGIARGPVVSYFTGGFAAGDVKTTVTEVGLVPFNLSGTRTGWVIGSGVEAALGGNWTGKIEYLYLDLGNRTDVFGTQSLRTELRENIFRVGLNYRIGGTGAYIAPPPANWAGLYIGGNFGGSATARNRTTATIGGFTEQFNLSPEGFIGGGQIGYNWQTANWVFGAEADFQGSTQKDDRTAVFGSTVAYNQKLPWFGTARARLGYSVGSTLLYATGGYAYGNVKTNIVTPLSNETSNRSRSGYAVGGGVEMPFSLFGLLGPNWTSKTEYLYVDLGSTTDVFAGGLGVSTSKVTEHMVRTGINYHFNQPVVAKY